MADELQFSQVNAPTGAIVVRVQGHMNARTTPVLLHHCRAVKDARKNLVLNLSGVAFIASSGIGGILALVGEFSELGLLVRFADLSPAVESVIKLLNLDSFLTIDPSESTSLQALSR